MTRVFISPSFGDKPDPGDGGVRRVVEAQRRYLPAFGVEVVEDPETADVLAAHIVAPRDFLSRYAAKPLVAHIHGFHWRENDWHGNWAEKINGEVMRLVKAADVVTSPSEWVTQLTRRHTSRDVRTIPHGIDKLLGATETEGYVLWNKTRVDPVCDPQPVLELARRLPSVRFLTTFLPEGVSSLPLGNVEVVGREPYADALGRVAHAGVYLATVRETFGIGILEAMSAGVPVVGFDNAGAGELVTHLQDGYLARPGDYDDLALGVRWALAHRAEIAPWARIKAERYLWPAAIEQYATLYKSLDAHRREQRPRVSIVVTAYGVEPYLAETLASVQMQATADWECIVVNDASPDGSRAIADRFAASDSRFRIIQNEQNVGVAESRNIGIRAARADLVLPLDGDDMLTPNAIDLLATALEKNRDLWAAYGNVLFLRDTDGSTAHSGWPVPFDLDRFFTGPGQPMPYSSMFRRKAWELTGGYRSRVRSSEDCDLWMRFASYGFDSVMATRADTLVYRVREGSRSDTQGHADVENKTWYPWRDKPTLAPAACGTGELLEVASLDPPLISVVIPVGPGHERLVMDAIDSVDAQTLREWECIVVWDSPAPIPEMPSWVRLITSFGRPADQPAYLLFLTSGSAGVAAARNAGIEASRAELYLPLDADDLLQPDALLTLYAAWWQGDHGDSVYADFFEDPGREGEFKPYGLPDFDASLLLSRGSYPVTALTPKAVWTAVGGYDGTMPWEDWDFQLKVAAAGHCSRRIAAPLWTYRKHTGTRRLDRAARRPQAEAAMLARWRDYIEGRKELMACSSCGGRATVGASARLAAARPPSAPEGAVKIRFIGAQRGQQEFRGHGTGTRYYFSANQPEKYVHAADAPFFLERVGHFQLAEIGGVEAVAPDAEPALTAYAHATPPTIPAPVGARTPVVNYARRINDAPPGLEHLASRPIPPGDDPIARANAAGLDVPPMTPMAGKVKTIEDLAVLDPEGAAAQALGMGAARDAEDMAALLPPAHPPMVVGRNEEIAEVAQVILDAVASDDLTRVPLDDAGNEVDDLPPAPPQPPEKRGRGRPRKAS